ncbi:hypothetical protein EEB14_55355 [Rhodococcus sp. WS4]|nr:hypothetical protein EEB14_55355 [Rhodococcus sp. WS4]
MQQAEQPYRWFVWVQFGRAAGPSPEQVALARMVEYLSVEGDVGVGVQSACGVGEDVTGVAGESEEHPQGVEVSGTVARVGDGSQERLYIADTDQRRIGDPGAVLDQVTCQIAHGGQVDLECAVGAGFGTGAAGPLTRLGADDGRMLPR